MKCLRFFLLFTAVVLMVGCAHYPDVRPGEKDIHEVIIKTERKGDGFQQAFAEAKDFCDDVYKKHPVRVKEKSTYIGSMDEKTYNQAKTASKIIEGTGAAVAIFGGKKESRIGAGAGVGGGVADHAIGRDYQFSMTFKCK
ncbi:MAG: hypothetical protein H7249_01020 [Chitinophagaceae bacterium]|nr:hypothetical protein [Oligoflexus sp.]